MTPDRDYQESRDRRRAMLRTAMGPAIGAALADPSVIEIMVNPDGSLRLDKHGVGRVDTDERLSAAEVERIIRLVASHIRVEVHALNPIVSAELPETGERFEGLLPLVSIAPCFAIRKPIARVVALDAQNESVRVNTRLAAAVELTVLTATAANGQLQTSLQMAMAYEDAIEAYKAAFPVGRSRLAAQSRRPWRP